MNIGDIIPRMPLCEDVLAHAEHWNSSKDYSYFGFFTYQDSRIEDITNWNGKKHYHMRMGITTMMLVPEEELIRLGILNTENYKIY